MVGCCCNCGANVCMHDSWLLKVIGLRRVCSSPKPLSAYQRWTFLLKLHALKLPGVKQRSSRHLLPTMDIHCLPLPARRLLLMRRVVNSRPWFYRYNELAGYRKSERESPGLFKWGMKRRSLSGEVRGQLWSGERGLIQGTKSAILGMHVLVTEGAGAADDSTRGNEHERSQGAKQADTHVSARIAPGRGSSTGHTPACAPGSSQTVLQRAALRGAAPPAADAS